MYATHSHHDDKAEWQKNFIPRKISAAVTLCEKNEMKRFRIKGVKMRVNYQQTENSSIQSNKELRLISRTLHRHISRHYCSRSLPRT